ncbi:MAG: alpha-amylase family glycosyl hydrolase [Bacteroidota bacterium]
MYEIFMRSFSDSDSDGIGDIRGIIAKLDYLDNLGIEGLWLTPFNKATSYHKYDVEDYYMIDPEYGTMDDFKELVREAHKRDIKVLMDLVVNHCSSKHPWFISACEGKGSQYRDWFVWSSRERIKSEPDHWHNIAGADTSAIGYEKYYGFFWSGMPDFNFDNPTVRLEMKKIGRYWLTEGGVDGFRLDAAQHIYPDDSHDKSQAWWREFRSDMETVKPDFFMVGEVVNKGQVVAPYLQGGMHAAFNFDLATSILKAVNTGNDGGLVQKLIDTRSAYRSFSSEYIDAVFVSNHDQDRIMSQVNDDPARARLAFAILMTLPGSPYLYYGEEIGMRGRKPDELIREPFPWSFSMDEKYNTSWEKPVYTVQGSVSDLITQSLTSGSMFAFYKQWLNIRRVEPVLYSGELLPYNSTDDKFLVYKREIKGQRPILIVHNLSSGVAEYELKVAVKKEDIIYGNAVYSASQNLMKIEPHGSVVIRL